MTSALLSLDEIYYDSIDLLKSLVATPSISKEEKEAADLLESYMHDHAGLVTNRHGNNIWTTALCDHDGAPTILLNSHIDTVKPVNGWSHDPFTPVIEYDNERLYGLGSNDAGASVVSLLAAFRYLKDKPRTYNLIYLASCEEEISGRNGIESVLSSIGKVDIAIVGEPTGMHPAIAEKGLMVLDGEATGISGHAARNEGVNAIYKAIDAINTLATLRFPIESPTLGPVKISVTQIESGTQHNVIPDKCKFVVDVRTTDAYSNIATLNLIRQAAPEVTLTPRSTRLNPSSIDQLHPIVQRLIMMGRTPFGSPTLSDQALISCQSLKLGPGDSSRSHSADEYILLSEIREAIEIYIRLLDGLNF